MSIKTWVADLPSTNYKALISIWLSVIVVLGFSTCIVFRVPLQTEAVYAVFLFLGGLMGIDTTQFIYKRKTEIVTPPQTMAENTLTTTVSTTGIPAPVLTKADVQLAAEALVARQREISAGSEAVG